MKKLYQFIFFVGITIFQISCNNDIAIKPVENSSLDSTINYNFKAIPDNDYYRANANGIYEADIELYFRPFQEIYPKTTINLVFKSNNFGVFVLKKDTLYPDDQVKMLASDFINFRKNGKFYTNNLGKQSLNFELEIGKTRKASISNFETK